MAQYEVRLKPSFLNTERRRAGIALQRGVSQVVELDEEQLALIEADEQILVKKVEAEETEEQRQAREEAEAEAIRRKERPTAEELSKDNNRDALIAKANELKVEGLDYEDKATTKAVIAAAIVAKRDNVNE